MHACLRAMCCAKRPRRHRRTCRPCSRTAAAVVVARLPPGPSRWPLRALGAASATCSRLRICPLHSSRRARADAIDSDEGGWWCDGARARARAHASACAPPRRRGATHLTYRARETRDAQRQRITPVFQILARPRRAGCHEGHACKASSRATPAAPTPSRAAALTLGWPHLRATRRITARLQRQACR